MCSPAALQVAVTRALYSIMGIRTRKFIGTIATVLYLIIYALIMMAIGGQYIVGLHGMLEFTFFVVAGLAWIPGLIPIIKWMSRPD